MEADSALVPNTYRYRSVLNLAKADQLTESFLWLPSLEGPVADYTQGIGWLTGNAEAGFAWNGLTPPLGWPDTLAYLVLPVLLVLSQARARACALGPLHLRKKLADRARASRSTPRWPSLRPKTTTRRRPTRRPFSRCCPAWHSATYYN